jgi:Carbohydrate esterase, sialic acid-specific acetylesterase
MEGYGKVDRGGDPDRAKIVCPLRANGTRSSPANVLGGTGSLRAMVNADPVKYSYLVDPSKTISYTVTADVPGCTKADAKTYSSWAIRDDVYVSNLSSTPINDDKVKGSGNLSVGFGADNLMRNGEGYIGPEFGFGHVVGKGLDDKVLLIKTSWGGKSLAVDFRPPSSVGLGVGSPTLAIKPEPDTTGAYYTEMVRRVKLVLSDVKKYYPGYDGKGYEVVGFGWHQGWNDRDNARYVAQYEVNMANLIRDLRKDLNLPNMLVVIGNTGMARAGTDKNSLDLINAQASVADPIKYPKFAGNVSTVDTRPFHYPDTSPEIDFIHHWNYSGESYFKVGDSMGTAMLKLMNP